MSDEYDSLPWDTGEIAPPTLAGPVTERKCARHKWQLVGYQDDPDSRVLVFREECRFCHTVKDEARSRRGKQSRNYGNRAELSASRKYGGDKVGAAGGPVDIRGKDFATQMKTHRRLPPVEWTKSFAAMSQDNRCPRMLLRFVGPSGVPPRDYFVFQADDFLAWFGRDE